MTPISALRAIRKLAEGSTVQLGEKLYLKRVAKGVVLCALAKGRRCPCSPVIPTDSLPEALALLERYLEAAS